MQKYCLYTGPEGEQRKKAQAEKLAAEKAADDAKLKLIALVEGKK